MEDWKEYKLGDVCTELSDGLHKAPRFIVGGDYIFVNAKNIVGGFIVDNDPTKKSSHEEYLKYSSPLNNTTILYSIDGTIGNIALYRGEKCILGKGACYLNPDPQKLDRMFLYYELQSTRFKAYIDKMSTGSTIKHISLKTMRGYNFLCPPLATQYKISSILKSIDDKIECNRRINENLEQQAQALFKSWFVDFEPFKDQPFVESELGMIPQGWKVGRLSDIANITMGTSPSGSSYNVIGDGDVFYQGRAEFDFRFPRRNMYTTEAKRFADIDSVLLSVRAPVGDINVAEEKCCIGRGLASVKSNEGNNSYILYLMKSLNPVFDQFNGEGTVFGSINKKALEELSILIAPNKIRVRFEAIANKIDGEIKALDQESRRLAELRDTLLPRLMSGEIKVEDVTF